MSVNAVVAPATAAAEGFVSEPEAASELLSEFPGGTVVDSSLVEIQGRVPGSPDVTVWALAVNGLPLIGSNGPAGAGTKATVLCTIVFLDAATGKPSFGIQEGMKAP